MLRLSIAKKLLQLLDGKSMPLSQLRYPEIQEMIADNIIIEIRQGRTKSVCQLRNNQQAFNTYLSNRYDIHDLKAYVDTMMKKELSKAELVHSTSDSKAKSLRSFKGFLVNCYEPVSAMLNNVSIIIKPVSGTFQFIYDFETFVVDNDITIVGVENAENFRNIEKQRYLFEDIKPLFVSRYPQTQNKDLLRWLQNISNRYLHFGDFDFAGIRIFLFEYFRHLGSKTSFFIPENIEILIKKYGSSKRYDKQLSNIKQDIVTDENLLKLIRLIHLYKKGLDQEALIRYSS
jgi:hypothetical protein